MRRAVFLDRDGVLNAPLFRDGRSFAPRRLDDFHIYPDAAPSVRRLKAAGFLVIVVTNQPDIGAGFVSADEVQQMHRRLRSEIPVDAIEMCTETREQAAQSGSRRRKPDPGMLIDSAAVHGIDLSRSYMVGDRASDVEAGQAAGCCASLFVDRGYTAEPGPSGAFVSVASLGAAVDWILQQAGQDYGNEGRGA